MASNIKEKNLVYSFDEYYGLPYDDVKSVDYTNENAYVNSIALNNTYQQLIDNDKVVAQVLDSKKSQKIGPTVLNDVDGTKQQIDDLADGQKFFYPNDSHIYRKVNHDRQSCLFKASSTTASNFSGGAKSIFKLTSNQLFVSVTGNTYLVPIKNIQDGTSNDIPGVVVVKTTAGKAIRLYSQCKGNYSDVFFGGVADSKNGLYVNDTQTTSANRFTLFYQTADPVTAVAYQPLKSMLAFASGSTLYVTTIDNETYRYESADGSSSKTLVIDNSNVEVAFTTNEDVDGRKITNICFASTNDGKVDVDNTLLLFMDDGSILASCLGSGLNYQSEGSLFSARMNAHIAVNGYDWFATDKGIFRRAGNSTTNIWPGAGTTTTAAHRVNDLGLVGNNIYFGNNNGSSSGLSSISMTGSSYEVTKVTDIANEAVSAIDGVYGIPFIGTNKSLRYYVNEQLFELKHDNTKLPCTQILAKTVDDDSTLVYAAGSNFLAVSSVSLPTYSETNNIDRTLSNITSFGDHATLMNTFRFAANDDGDVHSFAVISSYSGSNTKVQIYDLDLRIVAKEYQNTFVNGIVVSDSSTYVFVDGNIEKYSKLQRSRPYSRIIQIGDSFMGSTQYRVVDGVVESEEHIITLLSTSIGSYISYGYYDSPSNSFIHNDSNDLVSLGKATPSKIFAYDNPSTVRPNYLTLKGSGSNTMGQLTAFSQADTLDDFQLDGCISSHTNSSTQEIESEWELTSIYNFSDYRICPGPMKFIYGGAGSDNSNRLSAIAYRQDYLVPLGGDTNVSSIISYIPFTEEGFQIYASQLSACAGSTGVANIKFMDKSLSYRHIALLCPTAKANPATGRQYLSVVAYAYNTDQTIMDNDQFDEKQVAYPAALFESGTTFSSNHRIVVTSGSSSEPAFVDAEVYSSLTSYVSDIYEYDYGIFLANATSTWYVMLKVLATTAAISITSRTRILTKPLRCLTYINGYVCGYNDKTLYVMSNTSEKSTKTFDEQIVSISIDYSAPISGADDISKFQDTVAGSYYIKDATIMAECDEYHPYIDIGKSPFKSFTGVSRRKEKDRAPYLIVATSTCVYKFSVSSSGQLSLISTVDLNYSLNRSSRTIYNILGIAPTPYSVNNDLFKLNVYRDSNFSDASWMCRTYDSSQHYGIYLGQQTFANTSIPFSSGYPTTNCYAIKTDMFGNAFVIPSSTSNSKIYVYAKSFSSPAWVQISHSTMSNIVPCTESSSVLKFYFTNNSKLYLGTYSTSFSYEEIEQRTLPSFIGWSYNSTDLKRHFLMCSTSNGIDVSTFMYKMFANMTIKHEKWIELNSPCKKLIDVDGTSNVIVQTSDTCFLFDFNSNNLTEIRDSQQFLSPNSTYVEGLINLIAYDNKLSVMTSIYDTTPLALASSDKLQNYLIENDAQLLWLSQSGGTYHAFIYMSDKTYELTFTKYGSKFLMFTQSSTSFGTSLAVNGILDIGRNNFLVATTNGLYRYDYANNGKSIDDLQYLVYKNSPFGDTLNKIESQNQTIYTAATSNKVLSSTNGLYWNSYATIGADATNNICCYVQQNVNTFYAGKSTGSKSDNGFYFLRYSYDIIDDTPEFTTESAMVLYTDHEQAIDDYITLSVSNHIDAYHYDNSPNNILSDYMPVNFSMPDNFCTVTSKNDIKNDYIETIMVGDSDNEVIQARATNSTMPNGRWQNIDCQWIVKQWKSGIMEFFIYLPTTYTYYIPHVPGTPNCANGTEPVQANARTIEPTVSASFTTVEVDILSTYFYLDSISENIIKGNSLPLKIQKDQTYAEQEGTAASLFHSFIEPSIASDIDLTTTDFDNYTSRYFCFGSDAQAIKITAYDPKHNYLRRYKTVIYHGMGGKTNDYNSRDTISQRILEGDIAKHMYWEIFFIEGGIFLGWATSKNAQLPDIEAYPDTKTFAYSSMDRSIIHLYAIWTFYTFGPNDTQLTFDHNTENTYTIAQIKIDPNITFNDNPSLENRLIVKYE